MDITAQEVIDKYHEAIDNRSNATFAWPDDALCGHKWQYFVHVAWVEDWNKEGRETECIEFLTNWLTEENVSKALDDYRDFEGVGGRDA